MTFQYIFKRFFSWIFTVLFSAGVVIVLISGIFGWYSNKNEVSVKYVEIAANILASASTKDDRALRGWAVDVINEYVPPSLEIPSELKMRLINGETSLPIYGFGSFKQDDQTAYGTGTVGTRK